MSHTNITMDSTPTRVREENQVNWFMELLDIFDKSLKMAFIVIAFKSTSVGEALFIEQPNFMFVMIFMIELYYLLRLMETMLLQHDILKTMVIALRCLILLIGTISSALLLSILSPFVACFTATLRVTIFAFIAAYYCYHQKLHKLVAREISDIINKLFDMITQWKVVTAGLGQ